MVTHARQHSTLSSAENTFDVGRSRAVVVTGVDPRLPRLRWTGTSSGAELVRHGPSDSSRFRCIALLYFALPTSSHQMAAHTTTI